MAGDPVHHSLDRHIAARLRHAPVCADGSGVRGHGLGDICVIGDPVGPDDHPRPARGLQRAAEGQGGIGARVGAQARAERLDDAVVVEGDRDLVAMVAGMDVGNQFLAAVLDPFHRAAEVAGEGGRDELLGIDLRLCAEATADLGHHDAEPRFRASDIFGERGPQHVGDLCRGMEGQRPARFRHRQAAARFQRHAADPAGAEAAFEHMWRAGEGVFEVRRRETALEDQVVLDLVVDPGGAGLGRPLHVDRGGKRLVGRVQPVVATRSV